MNIKPIVLATFSAILAVSSLGFTGTPATAQIKQGSTIDSTCCPASAYVDLKPMFADVPTGDITKPYYLSFKINPDFDAQMKAYVTLANLTGTTTGIAMTYRLYDIGPLPGTPTPPTQIGQDVTIYWLVNQATNIWPGPLFSAANHLMQPNRNYRIETTMWQTGGRRMWPMECSSRSFNFGKQYSNLRVKPKVEFVEVTGKVKPIQLPENSKKLPPNG